MSDVEKLVGTESRLEIGQKINEIIEKVIDAGRMQETMATKSMVDGQWVYISQHIGDSQAAGRTTFDISNLLPNDSYNYECIFRMSYYAENSISMNIGTDLAVETVWIYNNYGRSGSGDAILAVGQGRSVSINTTAAPTKGNFHLYFAGYRRLGTNV